MDKQSKFLSDGLKQALYGIHERDGNVVTEPSRVDLDFLSAEYSKPLSILIMYYMHAVAIISTQNHSTWDNEYHIW